MASSSRVAGCTTFLIAVALIVGAVARLSAAIPMVTNVMPNRGPTAGGTTVIISGTGFTGTTQVSFGGVAAPGFVVQSDTSIQATTPAHAAGVVDVTVATADGSATLAEGFGYGPIPVAINDAYTTSFNTTLTVPSPGVLSNDDPNQGGGWAVELGANVTSGTLSLTANGGFTYTPNATFAGTDRFTYRSRNSTGFSNYASVTITVVAPTGPLAPTGLYVSAMSGDRVTLRWTAPPVGPPPTLYIIEGGFTPGAVVGSVTVAPTPIATLTLPSGLLFLRMYTMSGSARSAASNEILVFVNQPAAPTPPESVTVLVNDTTVALAWRNSFGGGQPTNLVLDVTGALFTTLPLGVTDKISFAGVPAGTYTFSLRAVNQFGSSVQTTPVTVTFPGPCTGPPLAPTNFLAYKVGTTIHVIWDPPAGGAAPTGYVLTVSGAMFGSFPTTERALSGTVAPGSYTLAVASTNVCGVSAPTGAQTISIP